MCPPYLRCHHFGSHSPQLDDDELQQLRASGGILLRGKQ
jgi:hypothetical protein